MLSFHEIDLAVYSPLLSLHYSLSCPLLQLYEENREVALSYLDMGACTPVKRQWIPIHDSEHSLSQSLIYIAACRDA